MYQKILVALENRKSDESLLPHVEQLAKLAHAHLLLLHVADGFVARNFNQLKLAESQEMRDDREYLERIAQRMRDSGIDASFRLALGNPPDEIIKAAESENCDLIAMTAHGHRWIGDVIFGSTIHEVRHSTNVPVLLVRASGK